MPDITDDIRGLMIITGVRFITGHKINELKFVVFSGKSGYQNVGSGDIFLPDFVIRRDPDIKLTPPVFIKNSGKYGWGVEAGKTAPFNASVPGN
jgi:hypothetical protein